MKIEDMRCAAQRAEEEAKASPKVETELLSAGDEVALAEQINTEHHAYEEAAKSALKHAIRCGELLAEAREIVRDRNGKWMTWLKKNFDGSKSTEENYRKLERNKEYLLEVNPQRVGNLSLREALALLVTDRGEPDSGVGEGKGSAGKTPRSPGSSGDSKGRSDRKEWETGEPEPQVYLGEDLPVEQRKLGEVLGEGLATVLSIDLPADDEEKLAQLREYLDAAVRVALNAEGEARLLLLVDTEPELRAVAEQALGYNSEKEAEERRRYERKVIRGADEGELTLYQAVVVERDGVRLPRVGRREEYDKVPLCYLGKNGLPGDEMASELANQCPHLGVRDEDSLLEALGARRKAAQEAG